MTRAKDISKIVTDADLSGTLDVTGDLTVDTNTLHVDSINNRVGIGTSSPSGKLNLATGASTACELRLTSNNTGSGAGDRGRIVVYSSRNDGTAYEAGKIEIDRSTGTTDEAHMLFATNGGSGNTERMRISSSGNVGIGTSSPTSNLHVSGANAGLLVDMQNPAGNHGLRVRSGNNEFNDGSELVLDVRSGTSNNPLLNVHAGGNVGIGTSSPSLSTASASASGLEINGTVPAINLKESGGDEFLLYGGGSSATIYTVNNLRFLMSGSEKMRITSGGNVGIGTSSPATQLMLQSAVNSTGYTEMLRLEGQNLSNGWERGITFTGNSGAVEVSRISSFLTGSERHLRFTSAGTLGMTIRESGNVGINESSPDTKLHISNNASGTPLATFECTASHEASIRFKSAHSSSSDFRVGASISASNNFEIYSVGASTARLQINSTGDFFVPRVYVNTTGGSANVLVASNGQFLRSTSSQRYKNTINDATHGLTELLTLRPVTYKGNNDGDTIFGGLIAEEVHDAGLTEFVQYNDDGEPDALAYGNMVSICIKAIQELKAELDSAKARITALENGE